jgi:hypothetical protein
MAEESETHIATSTKPAQNTIDQSQGTQFCGAVQNIPVMYPAALLPGLFPMMQQQPQDQNQINGRGGAGIYAVPNLPFSSPFISGYPPNTLIPFTYNIPTGTSSEGGGGIVGGEQGQDGQIGQQQQQQHQQQIGGQRQQQVVVRRFQVAIHLDLLLILKLAAVIFLLNQDGSRQRLVLLIFFATLVYLYQTGALAPVVRWLSQGMHRAARPVGQPPRPPPVRADHNAPLAAAALPADGHGALNEGTQENEDEQQELPPADGGNRWWGLVKEVQMIVFGFITSLLPGFHNLDD